MYTKNMTFLKVAFFILVGVLSSCSGSSVLKNKEGTPHDMDIYLLIGQSNMAGRAEIESQDKDTLKGVYLFTGLYENMWEPAANPVNKYSTIRKKIEIQKLGPGYYFAKSMAAQNPKKKIGLVVNAKGGTAISEWLPGTEFYKAAIERTKQAMDSGTLKGVIWHQGESDNSRTDVYMEKLSILIDNLRSDLGDEDLPFVAGQLSEDKVERKQFNVMILELPQTIKNTGVVTTENTATFDGTHFDSESQRKLGKRYADEMQKLIK